MKDDGKIIKLANELLDELHKQGYETERKGIGEGFHDISIYVHDNKKVRVSLMMEGIVDIEGARQETEQ